MAEWSKVRSLAWLSFAAWSVAACSEGAMPSADGARVDASDELAAMCDEASPCEPIDMPWEPDDGGDEDASDVAAIDGGFMDASAMDGARDASLRDGALVDGATRDAAADTGVALPLPTCANVNQRLRDDFGIVIRPGTLAFEGLATEDIACADRIKVYQMFMLPFAYQRYPVRLNPADAFTMHLYRTSSPTVGSCSAYVPSSQAMQIRDLRSCLASVSGTTDADFIRIAMFLIHESGHIITARTPLLRTAFSTANLSARDPSCYDRGFLKTYSLRSTNPVSESFAEGVALFIGNRKRGSLGTITNFRTECPNTYAWIHTNVMGDRR